MPSRMLDSKSLKKYLNLKSFYGDLSLIPKGSSNIRIANIKRLSEGLTNELYSFLLTFTIEGFDSQIDLVLKGYPESVALWFKTYRPNEDLRKYVREFEALKNLGRIGFPVPLVYLCESDSFFLGYPFVIMQREKKLQESVDRIDSFASTLARIHNLNVSEIEFKSIRFPNDDSAFVTEWLTRLKHFLSETRHYRDLRKTFNHAINWLELNAADNKCPQYCLIHGEYHPGHTLITKDGTLKVIDWEGVEIGDPAFDVGYAYHMVKLMCNEKKKNSGEKAAEQFVSEYKRNFNGDIDGRLDFYKVVGILETTIEVSSWMSNPLVAYRRFGRRALARSLAFPFLRSNFLVEKWLNADFIVSYLKYCQDFINTTL